MSLQQRSLLIRTVIFLFALNSLSLALYFFLYPRPAPSRKNLTQTPHLSTLKPWPSLPSFLPWNPNPNPPLRSCEAYFGNGFSHKVNALGERGNGGWFRCFYSATLKSSVCEGGRVRMDPRKIRMSKGGERLELVMGRREEEELPRFEDGAFEIEGDGGRRSVGGRVVDDEFLDRYVPRNGIEFHAMRGLMKSMRIVGSGELQCSQAPLEETWEALFTSARYAKNFSASVCFRHVILSPLGYETAMFKGLSESFSCQGTPVNNLQENPDNQKTSRLSEFGEMLRAAFDLSTDENSITKTTTVHNILFVRREDYLAHPRHNGKLESRLSNEPEVFDSVQNWAANQTKCRLNVINGLFAHMTMKEQLRAIYEASLIIGAHGAGLTHLVSARSETIVLEIISSRYRRPHFSLISQWKGLEYHAINLDGSYARPELVIDALSSIVRSLGC